MFEILSFEKMDKTSKNQRYSRQVSDSSKINDPIRFGKFSSPFQQYTKANTVRVAEISKVIKDHPVNRCKFIKNSSSLNVYKELWKYITTEIDSEVQINVGIQVYKNVVIITQDGVISFFIYSSSTRIMNKLSKNAHSVMNLMLENLSDRNINVFLAAKCEAEIKDRYVIGPTSMRVRTGMNVLRRDCYLTGLSAVLQMCGFSNEYTGNSYYSTNISRDCPDFIGNRERLMFGPIAFYRVTNKKGDHYYHVNDRMDINGNTITVYDEYEITPWRVTMTVLYWQLLTLSGLEPAVYNHVKGILNWGLKKFAQFATEPIMNQEFYKNDAHAETSARNLVFLGNVLTPPSRIII